jgi:hypothetical protein
VTSPPKGSATLPSKGSVKSTQVNPSNCYRYRGRLKCQSTMPSSPRIAGDSRRAGESKLAYVKPSSPKQTYVKPIVRPAYVRPIVRPTYVRPAYVRPIVRPTYVRPAPQRPRPIR